MKKNLFILICVVIFAGIIAFYHEWSSFSSNQNLIVGLQSGYPPFEFVNKEGRIVGFDVDLANLIAKKMNKSLVIVDMGFDTEISALQKGRIDLIISGMNMTPERLKEILMIPYYGNVQKTLSLLFWKKIPEGVRSLDDIQKLPNNTISVATGSVSEAYLSRYPKIPIHSAQNSMDAIMDIESGKSIANLVEADLGEHFAKQYPEIKVLTIPIPEEFTVLGFGIGIKKHNVKLFDEVNQIVTELKASGEIKNLEIKWFQNV